LTHNIVLLDSQVIDQIAAGEVIERPAAVVKELLENALDAQASWVSIELAGGGLQRIVVADNGLGMSAEACRWAVVRHATSKLRCLADLQQLTSFGFRGEALSSIAAVAHLSLESRLLDQQLGWRQSWHSGEMAQGEPVACPTGTRVSVADLFYNVPVRRKFLKSPATETAHIVHAVARTVLAHPHAGVKLYNENRTLLHIPERSSAEERVRAALGLRRKTALTFVEYATDGIEFTGWLGFESTRRGEHKNFWFFVNGRYVRDRIFTRAVNDALQALNCPPLNVVCVGYLTLPTAWVDINVHPQKLEVRFQDAHRVYQAIVHAVLLWGRQNTDLPRASTLALEEKNIDCETSTFAHGDTTSLHALGHWDTAWAVAKPEGLWLYDWPVYWRSFTEWYFKHHQERVTWHWLVPEPLWEVAPHATASIDHWIALCLSVGIQLSFMGENAPLMLIGLALPWLAMDVLELKKTLVAFYTESKVEAVLSADTIAVLQSALYEKLLHTPLVSAPLPAWLDSMRQEQGDYSLAGCRLVPVNRLQAWIHEKG
jgi:DNA mismatch repair protein MutL